MIGGKQTDTIQHNLQLLQILSEFLIPEVRQSARG